MLHFMSVMTTSLLLCASILTVSTCTIGGLDAVENADAGLMTGISATMVKRGNIRYGPNRKAGIICTLNVNSQVQVISRAEGLSKWYKIQFPRQGHAWMHRRNLVATTGRMMRVTLDGAIARSDATVGAEVVAELPLNATVEWKGPHVGSWYAVYISTAVAYVHASVVTVDQDAIAQVTLAGQPAEQSAHGGVTRRRVPDAPLNHPVETLWTEAQATYERYYRIYQSDTAKGLKQDWTALSQSLEVIVAKHPRLKTKVYAERLRKGIARLVTGSAAPAPIVQQPTVVVTAKTPVVTDASDTNNNNVAVEPVAVVDNDFADVAVFAQTGDGIVGWLEQKEIESLGVKYVILGDDGIAAFLKLKADSNIDLTTMHWRRVIASGDIEIVDHQVSEEYKGIPLLILDEIHLKQ